MPMQEITLPYGRQHVKAPCELFAYFEIRPYSMLQLQCELLENSASLPLRGLLDPHGTCSQAREKYHFTFPNLDEKLSAKAARGTKFLNTRTAVQFHMQRTVDHALAFRHYMDGDGTSFDVFQPCWRQRGGKFIYW